MNEIVLAAQAREKTGITGLSNNLRTEGHIPAVVYGEGKPPMHISVSEKEMLKIIKTAKNNIISLKYSKDGDNVLIKAIQRHVVTEKLLHIDFQRISLSKEIEVEVHIKLIGEAQGVKLQGGLLQHGLRSITVTCLPTNIPKEIILDVTSLKMGDAIRVKDIKIEKAKIMDDAEQVIVNIAIPREEAETVTEEAGAEPEVTEKGKKEDGDKAEDSKKDKKAEDSKKDKKADDGKRK
ncbi:MAG: 50S ribosomal protein L25 [Elusimicrobia bacterium]|nr:50S ribosomal protein L25 [Elusimicrobiota bacterium]